MGVVSINLSFANEEWYRNRNKGQRSAAVNRAIDAFRYKKDSSSNKSLDEYTTHTLLMQISARCMGTATKDAPLGMLSEKEYARLKLAIENLSIIVEEFDQHEVIE